MNEHPPKLVLCPDPAILKQTAPQELDKVLSIKFYAEVTKRNRDTNRLESIELILSTAVHRAVLGVSQLKWNPLQDCTGCTLKFLLQRHRDVSASTTRERKVYSGDENRTLMHERGCFRSHLRTACLFVCYAWMSFRDMTSFCILH